jgi:thiol-disulfide isomerase/thioredoxin
MRTVFGILAILLLASASSIATTNKIQKADDILKAAQAKADDQHKTIFLLFDASWCEACHQLDTFLALPEVASILDKYFVMASLTIGEREQGHPEWDTPGADYLIGKYGGVSTRGEIDLPFFALLDARAKLIVNNKQLGKPRTPDDKGNAFPTSPEDIRAFVSLLQKAAPSMTAQEMDALQEDLKKTPAD